MIDPDDNAFDEDDCDCDACCAEEDEEDGNAAADDLEDRIERRHEEEDL